MWCIFAVGKLKIQSNMKPNRNITLLLLAVVLMALPAKLSAQIYEFRDASGLYRVEYIPNEKMALSCYRKAIEKLKDPDRPRFVRWYFHV